jgi:hypothetical protein
MTLQELNSKIDLLHQGVDSDTTTTEEKSKMRRELLKLRELKRQKLLERGRTGDGSL